jgi:hypothetical protein
MVQMDVDVPESTTAQRGNRFDVLRVVFIPRVKERMLRRSACGIGQSGDGTWVFFDPAGDARVLNVPGRAFPHRLVMVADAQKQVHFTIGLPGARRQELRHAGKGHSTNSHDRTSDEVGLSLPGG